MPSSALGCGGGVFEMGVTLCDWAADDETVGVIFIRFPSDGCRCCSGRGDGAWELGVLVVPVCGCEGAGNWGVELLGCVGVVGTLESEPSPPGEEGVGFPSFARRLLRI